MVIVPAALAILGRAAWWLPRWLDRVLPHLDAEDPVRRPRTESRELVVADR
jgi:RND superfamily putative drug exporter